MVSADDPSNVVGHCGQSNLIDYGANSYVVEAAPATDALAMILFSVAIHEFLEDQ